MATHEPFVSPVASASHNVLGAIGSRRWTICALLFFATTINYMDRQVLSILKPELSTIFVWNDAQYGRIVAGFQAAYALSLLVSGNIIDRIGTRRGLGGAVVLWSIAAMACGFAQSIVGFGLARAALGLGEGGNFPASIKVVSEWFPKRERALATGIFNSGSNIGAIVAPLSVPVIALSFGWQWAFILVGLTGFAWFIAWWMLYRTPEEDRGVSEAELAYINSDEAEASVKIPWRRIVPLHQTWAFALGKAFTDPIWWFYLSWLPDFFSKPPYKLDLKTIGLPLVVIYLMADVGSIGGGWLSSQLIKAGWSVNASRKFTLLLCAFAVVPVMLVPRLSNPWMAVGILGLATAAHQAWSANLFTLVSDTVPRRAVASVTGFGGAFGSLAATLTSAGVGEWLFRTGTTNYLPLFYVAGSAYLLAFLFVHFLNPQLRPARLSEEPPRPSA